jgi:hypothetical protein
VTIAILTAARNDASRTLQSGSNREAASLPAVVPPVSTFAAPVRLTALIIAALLLFASECSAGPLTPSFAPAVHVAIQNAQQASRNSPEGAAIGFLIGFGILGIAGIIWAIYQVCRAICPKTKPPAEVSP